MLAFSIAEEPVELPEAPCEAPREAETAAQTQYEEATNATFEVPSTRSPFEDLFRATRIASSNSPMQRKGGLNKKKNKKK